MRLRTRLALTLLALAVPLVASAVWLRNDLSRRGSIQALVDYARLRMNTGGKESCEAAPLDFQEPPPNLRPLPPRNRRAPLLDGRDPPDLPDPRGPLDPRAREFERRVRERAENPRPPPRLELWAYGPDFVSANPRAPAFPPDLRAALSSHEDEAGRITDEENARVTTVAARMAWMEGPCAVVLVRRSEPYSGESVRIDVVAAALLVGVLVLAVLLAVGPILRRLSKLEDGVRNSARTAYRESVSVEGRDEIADLACAFNQAGTEVRRQIDTVEARERSLRDFVANTTHDVMLPLTVLQGHLTRLRDDLDRGARPERETVREALEESHYLASLVQNLGAASKLEGAENALRADPFSWNALVERVILRHRTIAAEKGIELDFAVPEHDVRARGDVTLVEQALSNVVHNAVRYNHRGGHVAVVLEDSDGRFTLRVLDDGPGVAPGELEKIRERSYRTDEARARHPDGLGLGLSIAGDVAARHGFELTFASPDSGGLEVRLAGALLTPP